MRTFILALAIASAMAAPRGLPYHLRGHNKIVGGQEATPGQYPYQLSFQQVGFGWTFHFCGASIYDRTTAITAGHCVYGDDYDNPTGLQIVAGEHDLFTAEGNEQAVALKQIVLHEDYSPYGTINDISLLKLDGFLSFNDYVQPIALPDAGERFTGTAIVSGWGTLSSGGSSPDKLQWVEVPIVSDVVCRAAYGSSSILDSMMCAGEEGHDSCQGDSGGPLNCGGKLCGVVSWGRGCAAAGYPGVYTEVSYFLDWIAANA